jgi:Rieske Fe-S protein
MEVASIAVGSVLLLGPFLAGLVSFLDPLLRRNQLPAAFDRGGRGKEGFYRVAVLDALTAGGPPQRFPVVANALDAWNILPEQPVGAVYIQRTGEDTVRVFNATCPHAGCSVASDGNGFHCPCHNSSFDLDGSKRQSAAGSENPSPRTLDSLEVDPEMLAQGEIWVEYKNFFTGIDYKKPKL